MNQEDKRPSTVIIGCPRCYEQGEADANTVELTCPECGHVWDREPLRTADETIAVIRKALNESQDATRRAFYAHEDLLRVIARTIDAYPDPPLPRVEPLVSINLSWANGGGTENTMHREYPNGWAAPPWRGSIADALEIVKKKYGPGLGLYWSLVVVNAQELLK